MPTNQTTATIRFDLFHGNNATTAASIIDTSQQQILMPADTYWQLLATLTTEQRAILASTGNHLVTVC